MYLSIINALILSSPREVSHEIASKRQFIFIPKKNKIYKCIKNSKERKYTLITLHENSLKRKEKKKEMLFYFLPRRDLIYVNMYMHTQISYSHFLMQWNFAKRQKGRNKEKKIILLSKKKKKVKEEKKPEMLFIRKGN